MWRQQKFASGGRWSQLGSACVVSALVEENGKIAFELGDEVRDRVMTAISEMNALPKTKQKKREPALNFEIVVRHRNSANDCSSDVSEIISPLRSLAWLCLRAGADVDHEERDAGGDNQRGDLVDESREVDEIDSLLLLAQSSYVSTVERLMYDIRKGYVVAEERVTTIRGRVTERGIREYEMTGSPEIECRFDEFIDATPLYRVLVSALDVVSSGTIWKQLAFAIERTGLVGNDGFVWGSGNDVSSRAFTLREQLRAIPSLARPVALSVARSLRLTRLQKRWQPALDLARRILRAESLQTGGQKEPESSWVFKVQTPRVWEMIVRQAIERTNGSRGITLEQYNMEPPWEGHGNRGRRADLVHVKIKDDNSGINAFLFDAKYGSKKKSNIANQYKMFAYSLLQKPKPIRVFHVYCSPAGTTPAVPEEYMRTRLNIEDNHSGLSASECRLIDLSVSFPSQEQVGNGEEWRLYVEDLADQVVRNLGLAPPT